MHDNLQKADLEVKRLVCDLQTLFLQNAAMERHQRLKAAREQVFRTAKEAAESLDVPYGTYTGHEAGTRGIKDDELSKYARRFKVPLEWLSFGIGSIEASRGSLLRVVGRVGAGAQIDVDVEQSPGEFESVEVKFPLPDGVIGFEILGDSMWPRYEEGDIVVCIEDGVDLDTVPDGAEAAVRTDDGLRYLKKIVRTDSEGVYNLESHNAPVIRGVKLEWASDVVVIIPKRKWRKIDDADRQRLLRGTSKKKAVKRAPAATAAMMLLLLTPLRAQDASGRQIIAAAITAMEHLTLPRGKLTIYSGELAKSDAGITFRKLADCVYGMQDGKHVDFVDFSSLTGAYTLTRSGFGYRLAFAGRSARTRCFDMGDGSAACQKELALPFRSRSEIQPIVDAVTLILRSGLRKGKLTLCSAFCSLAY